MFQIQKKAFEFGRRSRNFTFSEDKFVQEHHHPKQHSKKI
jgi:hypothetical protein